jgi:hypothetical protein
MKTASCPRSFEAEAMRDGRLGDAERANFERHMTTCAVCEREARSLEALAEALRGDRSSVDELHVRRERTRLLAAFDHALVTPERPSGARRQLLLAAVLAGALGVVLFLRARPTGAPTSAVVHANETAVWSQQSGGGREKVVLERGTLSIHVSHAPGQRPVLVLLPDGELEDTGTTFTVSAEGGHTTRVAVEEGSVILRINGQRSVSIGAGETWSLSSREAALPSPSSSATAVIPPSSSATAVIPPSSSAPAVIPQSSIAPLPSAIVTATRPAPVSSALGPDPSTDFRAAMAALDQGDNARAAGAFARFVSQHPQDPRAEDAAYLRVIALQRSGDASAMNDAAREYLRHYPSGFRRSEVEVLSR